jgi:hypothetical protein
MKMGENLKARLNNLEEKARKNIKTEETEEEFDVIFDSIMQMCEKERKKLDKSADIVGVKLKNQPNNEIKNLSTTKYDKLLKRKNLNFLALHEIEPDSNFGSSQVLFSDLNAITKETLQDKLLNNQSEAIQNEKKKLYKVNSISSWLKRLFRFKKGFKTK